MEMGYLSIKFLTFNVSLDKYCICIKSHSRINSHLHNTISIIISDVDFDILKVFTLLVSIK